MFKKEIISHFTDPVWRAGRSLMKANKQAKERNRNKATLGLEADCWSLLAKVNPTMDGHQESVADFIRQALAAELMSGDKMVVQGDVLISESGMVAQSNAEEIVPVEYKQVYEQRLAWLQRIEDFLQLPSTLDADSYSNLEWALKGTELAIKSDSEKHNPALKKEALQFIRQVKHLMNRAKDINGF